MNYKVLAFFLSLGLFAACAETASPEQQNWDEVMAIHDEVMPKISDINKTVKAFKDIRENDTELFTRYREQILINLQNLESAEEGMFTWMNELKRLPDLKAEMSQDEVLQYLEGEKTKVSKVKEDMLSSLSRSQELLETMKKETAQ